MEDKSNLYEGGSAVKYINYKSLAVEYDESTHAFTLYSPNRGSFLRNGRLEVISYAGHELRLADYQDVAVKVQDLEDGREMEIKYVHGPDPLPEFHFRFMIDKKGIQLSSWAHADFQIRGDLFWGEDPEHSTFAVRLDGGGSALRVAHGPAASRVDRALYDRISDSVLEFDGCDKLRLGFDWSSSCYTFRMSTATYDSFKGFKLKVHENYYARKFSVPHKPMLKNHQFPAPPSGWMTWYAVQFEAAEQTVLENARFIADNLKDYGVNCIWVDWEWYHSNLSGNETPGVDSFRPHQQKYPRGLKYVSDEIKAMGLIPALWIGATNDPNLNEMFQAHPEWVLAQDNRWCGQWWIDPSHPGIVSEFIPAVFRQLLDWGYDVFKWDCLPVSLQLFDQYHERFHDRSKSPEQAVREVIQAARNVIGDDRYMMSCSGTVTRDITFAADYFDGARVGGDIFKWEEFVDQCLDRAHKYYLYHNVLWYADMDNIIVRKEYNNMEQACSRASFYGLTGVPVTMGDHLPGLGMERIELLKRIVPAIDIHPMEIRELKRDTPYMLVNLFISKSFGTWNVVDVLNITDEELSVRLDLGVDLCLDIGQEEAYLVYDFWNREFLGLRREALSMDLPPHGSKVVSLHKLMDRPQLISTSRHITQGACEIETLEWDEEGNKLSGESRLIRGEACKLAIHVPPQYELMQALAGAGTVVAARGQGNGVWEVELLSEATCAVEWAVEFSAL
ncbi:MAG: alpha-galactosidase [Paenibacillaceae bacterium]|jgi:hypothetical protein|nr:alpha-galactosidase [Paenibacillaceae bacterium]